MPNGLADCCDIYHNRRLEPTDIGPLPWPRRPNTAAEGAAAGEPAIGSNPRGSMSAYGYKRTSGALVKTNPTGFYEYAPWGAAPQALPRASAIALFDSAPTGMSAYGY